MVISSCKVKMDVKPNLYTSLDIIPKIGMNGSKPRSNCAQNGLLHHQISPKQSKMVRNGSKLQKGGKKFQNFSINTKKFKNYISFEIFTHLSSELQTRILRASFGEIRHRLFQVTSHVLLFHFHVIFFNFHGQFFTFRPFYISRFGPRRNQGFFHVQGWLYAKKPHKLAYIHGCFANKHVCGRAHVFLKYLMTKNYF